MNQFQILTPMMCDVTQTRIPLWAMLFCLATFTIWTPTVLAQSCASQPNNLVGWWPAEGNANDAVGTNNGTTLFGIAYEAGKVGQAFSFNASSRRVSIPDSDTFKLTNSLTIEGWIFVRGDGGFIFFRGDNRNILDPYALTMGAPGRLSFHVESLSALINLDAPIAYNQWKHVAATLDGASGEMKIYVDAVLAAQTNTTIRPLRDLDPSFEPAIGIGNHGGTLHSFAFNGLIDEISLYARALTQSEIQGIFNAGATGKCSTGVGPTITLQPISQTVPTGSDVTFISAASGTPPLSFRWQFNGTNIAGATGTSLVLTNVQITQAGVFSVRVTNLFGSAISSGALLAVLPPLPCTPAPLDPVAWWPADGNANDVVGANNGSLAGATFKTGKVGQAFNCNGSGQKVTVPDYDALKLTNSLTIEGWIFANGPGFIFFRGDSRPGLDPYALTVESSGPLQLLITASSGAQITLRTTNAVPRGQWKHVAASLDGGSGAMQLYLDGAMVAQTNTSLRPLRDLDAASGAGVGIGGHSGTYNYFPFNGLIDEISLYARALSPSEIQAIFSAGVAGKCKTPPSILLHPLSQRVTVGSNVTFNVAAGGTPQLRYQWRRNTTNLAGATGSALSFIVQPTSGGLYSVRVTNAFGSVISSNAVLTINTVPVALAQTVTLDEDTAPQLTLQGTDLENDPLTYSVVTPPAHGTLTGSGTNRTYTPAPNYFGPDSFTFKVNDGLVDSAPATVSLNVLPVNDPPVAFSQAVALDEDTLAAITLGAFDADGDALVFTVGAPAHGALTGTPPNLSYRPHTNYFGPDSFTFSVSDGLTSSVPATVSLTVRSVNDAPVAQIVVAPLTALPDATNLLVLAPVCGNIAVRLDGSHSSDAEQDPLQYLWLEGTNVLGTAVIQTNEFAPGVHELTLVVSDGTDRGTNTLTFEVLTPGAAVAWLAALVSEADLGRNAQPLLATLRAAAASFERCDVKPGINQLEAFLKQVRAQVAPGDRALADKLNAAAQGIIQAASGQWPTSELEQAKPRFSPLEPKPR